MTSNENVIKCIFPLKDFLLQECLNPSSQAQTVEKAVICQPKSTVYPLWPTLTARCSLFRVRNTDPSLKARSVKCFYCTVMRTRIQSPEPILKTVIPAMRREKWEDLGDFWSASLAEFTTSHQ